MPLVRQAQLNRLKLQVFFSFVDLIKLEVGS